MIMKNPLMFSHHPMASHISTISRRSRGFFWFLRDGFPFSAPYKQCH